MNKDQLIGLLRHVLTFGGGFLVTSNVLDDVMLSELIGGVVSIVGVVWSIADKRKK